MDFRLWRGSGRHLLLVFAQLSPHLSGLPGDVGDGDAGVLCLDPLSAGVEPQHVGAHRPLRTAAVLLLLLLGESKQLYRLKENKKEAGGSFLGVWSLTSLRGFLSFLSLTTLAFLAFFFLAPSSSLSSPSSLLSLAEALLSYLIDKRGGKRKDGDRTFTWKKPIKYFEILTLLQSHRLPLQDWKTRLKRREKL